MLLDGMSRQAKGYLCVSDGDQMSAVFGGRPTRVTTPASEDMAKSMWAYQRNRLWSMSAETSPGQAPRFSL